MPRYGLLWKNCHDPEDFFEGKTIMGKTIKEEARNMNVAPHA